MILMSFQQNVRRAGMRHTPTTPAFGHGLGIPTLPENYIPIFLRVSMFSQTSGASDFRGENQVFRGI